jgi:hypothetical protein
MLDDVRAPLQAIQMDDEPHTKGGLHVDPLGVPRTAPEASERLDHVLDGAWSGDRNLR